MTLRAQFAQDVRSRRSLVGTFVKSNDPAVIEILGHSGFDFAILDAEHAALDRADVARMALASRAAQLPLLVRIPEATGAWIATVLDAGCAGVMVPQVADARAAAEVVQKMRYGAGGLGFSPSTPGAGYGTRGIAGHLAQQPAETLLVCQIEDRDAVADAARIAEVDGVDGVFLGPVDLAVSLALTDPAAAEVTELCEKAIAAGAAAHKSAGLFLADLSMAEHWQVRGATLFVVGSDQSFLMKAAKAAVDSFRNARGAKRG